MTEERKVVVETVQLTKIYRDFWMRPKAKALDNVEIQVERGEIFGLLGPNGSGKSTLIKILLGLLFPTKGRAAIFGRDPRNIAVKDRIGYMPEDSYLYRYLNAEETLHFYGNLFNLPKAERKHRVELLLDMVGLSKQRKRPIVEYSKGMARRIGLAQALINDPDLVFLDEPTTGLDPIGTREIKDLIVELKKRGKTVVLCSHLLSDVEDVCDRVAILYGGRVRRLGSMEDLLRVRAKTQITSEQLKAGTIKAVVALIQEMEGDAKEINVEAPKDRLESFFLRVVEEARAAKIETSGVTVGASASSFFSGISRENKAEDVFRELLKTSSERRIQPLSEPEPGQVVVPSSPQETKADSNLIQSLLQNTSASPLQKPEKETEQPIVIPAGKRENAAVSSEIINSLLGKPKPSDEDTGNDSEK